MYCKKRLLFALASAAITVYAQTAAAGGLEIGDQGAKGMGRAGAYVVGVEDVSAIDYNPANLTKINGTQLYLSNRFSYADERYKRAQTLDYSQAFDNGLPELVKFPTVKNETPFGALGTMFGAASNFGLSDWAFAFGVYGPPGIEKQQYANHPNTLSNNNRKDSPQKYMLLARDVMLLYYSVSAAWKYRDVFGVGASLQYVDMPKLRFDLVIDGDITPMAVNPVNSQFDMISSIEGKDRFNMTAIVGAWYRPFEFLEFAFSGRLTPIKEVADCKLNVKPFSPEVLKLNKVKLTKNGAPYNDVTFSLTLPIKFRAGARYVYKQNDKELFDVELNLGYEAWSMMDKFVMDAGGIKTEVLNQSFYINKIVIKKGLKDTFSLRLGGDYNVIPDMLAVRGGFFYETKGQDEPYAYVDFYSFHRVGPSLGASLKMWGFDLSLAYAYVFQIPIIVREEESKTYQQVPGSKCVAPYTDPMNCNSRYYGQPSAVANAGVYIANYHFFSAGLTYTF